MRTTPRSVAECLQVHIRLQMLPELLLDPLRGRLGHRSGPQAVRTAAGACCERLEALCGQRTRSCLDLAHRQLARDDLVRQLDLTSLVLDGKQGARVASGDLSALNQLPHSGASVSTRSRFVIVVRSFPTASATCCWVRPNSSMSRWYPSASSRGLRSARWRFSTSARVSMARSSKSRTTAGSRSSRCRVTARRRRSPATSSQPPSTGARTTMGCRSPLARMMPPARRAPAR